MANTPAKYISLRKNKLVQFVIYSNLWIALGASLLSYQVYLLNEIEVNFFYLLFVYCATLVSYTTQRLFRISAITKVHPNSWLVKNKQTAILLSFLGIIGALYSGFQFLNTSIFLWLVPTGLISVLYSYKGLRDVPYLKIALIGLSWGIICGVLPFVINNEFDLYKMATNFSWVMFYIIAITIPFDIRDIGLDEDSKRTIPQVLGEKNAKLNAYCMLVISLALYYNLFNSIQFIVFFVSLLIASVLIAKSSQQKPDLFFSFGIDGHIILQFLLVYFLC